MFVLSILGILVACLLMANCWSKHEQEKHEARMRRMRIRWYTDDEE